MTRARQHAALGSEFLTPTGHPFSELVAEATLVRDASGSCGELRGVSAPRHRGPSRYVFTTFQRGGAPRAAEIARAGCGSGSPMGWSPPTGTRHNAAKSWSKSAGTSG